MYSVGQFIFFWGEGVGGGGGGGCTFHIYRGKTQVI